jgi:hypothetical protein
MILIYQNNLKNILKNKIKKLFKKKMLTYWSLKSTSILQPDIMIYVDRKFPPTQDLGRRKI